MSEPSSKQPYLDNTAKTFLENLAKNAKPLYEIDPEDAREFLTFIQEKGYKDIDAQIEDITISDENAGEISVRLIRPKDYSGDENLPLIIYCHGGGWVMGCADNFDMTIKTIANHTHSALAFVNYSRAPEFQYPTALNQIYAVLEHFSQNGGDYKINPYRIAIMGDSAGGNMAAATAIRTKLENGPQLVFQVLVYPVTDAEMKTDSYKEFKDGPWLSKKAMEYFWNCYLPDKDKRNGIYISPLKAEIEYLKGVAPALVLTAENDVLRDEGEAYARKLIEAGVDTGCVRINNTFHDFLLLNGLRESRGVKSAYKLICKTLKHALHN